MAKTRNLIIGCDGTWNDSEQKANLTNVAKLLNALSKNSQVQHYEKGVGTRPGEKSMGGIFGKGLSKRILGAYRFLQNRFTEDGFRNRVFIFGFSRGAYTARRISGLIAHSGIPKNPRDVKLGWTMYLNKNVEKAAEMKEKGRFFDIEVEMAGVWDTVKATNDEDYHDMKLPANVKAGYHAIAIDEKRKFFPVLRWKPNARVQEIWFPGVHSDVGGGYDIHGLSDIALLWMINCALDHGVKFKKSSVDAVNPDPLAEIHESYKAIWELMGKKQRTIRKNDLVHVAVKMRMDNEEVSYSPRNLPKSPNFISPNFIR